MPQRHNREHTEFEIAPRHWPRKQSLKFCVFSYISGLRYETAFFDTFGQHFGELLLVTPHWRTFFLASFRYRRILALNLQMGKKPESETRALRGGVSGSRKRFHFHFEVTNHLTAIPNYRDFNKWKFSFFLQRRIVDEFWHFCSHQIVTNVLPKRLDILLFYQEKNYSLISQYPTQR